MKHTIWSNMNLDEQDWIEECIESYGYNSADEIDENELTNFMYNRNNDYLDDERANLNITTKGRIIAIADLGLWNGRVSAYKMLQNCIADCLFSNGDYAEFYCDDDDFGLTESHHDGTNYITYREINPKLSEKELDNFLDKIYNQAATTDDIERCTKSLRPYIAEVYGW